MVQKKRLKRINIAGINKERPTQPLRSTYPWVYSQQWTDSPTNSSGLSIPGSCPEEENKLPNYHILHL